MRTIVVSAALVILLGGMKLASALLSPIIFAVFLAVLCLPIVRWLQRKGLPTWASLLLLIVGVLALGVALILFIFLSLGQVRDNLPAYQAQRVALRGQIEAWLSRLDIDLATTALNLIDPATIISFGSAQQFFYLRTINNLIVAVGSAVFLVVMRVDFGLLWAVVIFFLSYIPNIGIIVACIPAVVLALLQHDVVTALVIKVMT